MGKEKEQGEKSTTHIQNTKQDKTQKTNG